MFASPRFSTPILLVLAFLSISQSFLHYISSTVGHNNNNNIAVKTTATNYRAKSSSCRKHTSMSMSMSNIEYRNAQEKDLESIGLLCSVAFDGPFSWFQIFEKAKSEETCKLAIRSRYFNFVLKNNKHSMIVAYDKDNQKLAGFVEIGQLPSPIKDEGAEISADVSYLGNVAVSPDYRRQSIATKLIRISCKLLEKWQDEYLYAAVDCDNFNALSLYTKIVFDVLLYDRELIFRKPTNTPRIYMRKKVLFDKEYSLTDDDSASTTSSGVEMI